MMGKSKKQKTEQRDLPGGVKITMGKSMEEKLEYAKKASAGIKGFKS